MAAIHQHSVAEAPLSAAFAYIDDATNVPTWMFGIKKFEPLDLARPSGLGAIFDASFQVGAVKLSSRVEITEWKADELIELTSIKGFKNTSSWRFEADGPDRTTISVTFTYELPGGIAGRAFGKAVEPVLALTVKHSDANLRKHIAETYAARLH